MILPWRRDLIKSTNAGAAGSFHPMCLKNVVKFTRQIEQDTEDASFDLRFTFSFLKKNMGQRDMLDMNRMQPTITM